MVKSFELRQGVQIIRHSTRSYHTVRYPGLFVSVAKLRTERGKGYVSCGETSISPDILTSTSSNIYTFPIHQQGPA